MKSLADQLREQLAKPAGNAKVRSGKKGKLQEKEQHAGRLPAILQSLEAFDTTGNKHMVHARFDAKTVDLLNKFKMATGIDVSKTVAFAVHQLLATHPEIKTTIKQFIQNTDL